MSAEEINKSILLSGGIEWTLYAHPDGHLGTSACQTPLKMLFVFLVDDDVEMKSSILGPSKDDSSNFPFQATCLDGALYFVEYFSKVGRG